jgi:hypothetical protein
MKLTVAAILLTLTPLALTAQSSVPAMPAMPAKPPVTPSTLLSIYLDPQTPVLVFNVSLLQSLPQQTITAVDGHTGKTVTFTGPLVADVLHKAGLPSPADAHERILRSFVRASGTDGYFVCYSLAEMEPAFSSGKVIIALEADGKPVESGMQLVNPLDIKPARWVHGLQSLVLTQLTPASPAKLVPPPK